MCGELTAQLLLDLTNALLGHAKGLGASLLAAKHVVDDATGEDGAVVVVEGVRELGQGDKNSLAILRALKTHVLTHGTVGDDGGNRATVLGEGLVEADTATGHGGETLAHVIRVEVEVSRNLLWGRVLADDLTRLLE